MLEPITIVHISDLHARIREEGSLEIRTKALFKDIEEQGLKVDIVLFTGDVAFSGQPDEYDLARKLIFTPCSNRLKVDPKNIIIIPGNHDVDRREVDTLFEENFRNSLTNTQIAERYVDDEKFGFIRLKNFHDFLNKYQGLPRKNYRAEVRNINGIKIGFACLNSAWRCSGEFDEKALFITEQQVNPCVKELEHCDLKFALIHHPLEWLHPSEQEVVVPDIKQQFDVIVRGHLHANVTVNEGSTTSACITFAAPAIYDGRHPVGYNIYQIRFADKSISAKYRKFVRDRREFDANTDHAKNGEKTFPLTLTDLVKLSKGVLAQRIAGVGTDLSVRLKEQLQLFQPGHDPILVTPPVQKVVWKDGGRTGAGLVSDVSTVLSNVSLITGAAECGKTILLHTIGTAVNNTSALSGNGQLAVYVDLAKNANPKVEKIFQDAIAALLPKDEGDNAPSSYLLLVDHPSEANRAQIDAIIQVATTHDNWQIVLAVSNTLIFDAILATNSSHAFFEIVSWGPSRIRQLSRQFFSTTSVDVNAAYEFVCQSLRNTDLPSTPVIVLLYLSVFPHVGSDVSSLSFLRLLEKYEERRFGQLEASSTNSLYNKQRILAILAAECLRTNSKSVARAFLEKTVEDYFAKRLLPINPSTFIRSLLDSGILDVVEGNVQFRAYVFFDYYLAKAFQEGIIDVEQETESLVHCVSIADALALYGGLFRGNAALAKKMLQLIENSFPSKEKFNLESLDKHINDLFLPAPPSEDVDDVTSNALTKEVDYTQMDTSYVEERKEYEERRNQAANHQTPSSDIEKLNLLIGGLASFYKVFRNLENIEGEDKINLIVRILDFHIQCTLDLINYFNSFLDDAAYKTFFSYIVTIGSQILLYQNIGNQSLRLAIEGAIAQTDNDFKKMLLVFLYADLRLHGYEEKLAELAQSTQSRSAVEMIYMKLYSHMVVHEGTLPTALISAFRIAFEKRTNLYDQRSKFNRGKLTKGMMVNAFESARREIEKENLIMRASRGALDELL